MRKDKKIVAFLLIGCVFLVMLMNRRRNSIVVTTKMGQAIRIRTGTRLSPSDKREDTALQRAVSRKTKEQLGKGIPVARYDAKKKAVYVEYPDGRVQYQS